MLFSLTYLWLYPCYHTDLPVCHYAAMTGYAFKPKSHAKVTRSSAESSFRFPQTQRKHPRLFKGYEGFPNHRFR